MTHGSLAPLLPDGWDLRVVDENTEPLRDEALRWADVVLLTGMIIHAPAMHEILARARRLGKRTVVGGPAVNTDPGLFPEADHLFRGEAEGRTDDLVDYRRRAPNAARNHPSEEHFLPFFTTLGAAGAAKGRRVHASTTYGALAMDAYRWD